MYGATADIVGFFSRIAINGISPTVSDGYTVWTDEIYAETDSYYTYDAYPFYSYLAGNAIVAFTVYGGYNDNVPLSYDGAILYSFTLELPLKTGTYSLSFESVGVYYSSDSRYVYESLQSAIGGTITITDDPDFVETTATTKATTTTTKFTTTTTTTTTKATTTTESTTSTTTTEPHYYDGVWQIEDVTLSLAELEENDGCVEVSVIVYGDTVGVASIWSKIAVNQYNPTYSNGYTVWTDDIYADVQDYIWGDAYPSYLLVSGNGICVLTASYVDSGNDLLTYDGATLYTFTLHLPLKVETYSLTFYTAQVGGYLDGSIWSEDVYSTISGTITITE